MAEGLVEFDPTALGDRKSWTGKDCALYRGWCRNMMLTEEACRTPVMLREMRSWPPGRLEDMTLAAKLATLSEEDTPVPADVESWTASFRSIHQGLAVWHEAPADGWRRFFGESAEGYDPFDGGPLVEFFVGRFREGAPYKSWSRSAPLRDASTWSREERAEIDSWPAERLDDARLAGWISERDDRPEVRSWFDGFAKKAYAHCRRWGHSPERAEDLVQGFWAYSFRTNLWDKYSPAKARLFSYLFRCFVNEFLREGAAVARRDAAEAPPEEEDTASADVGAEPQAEAPLRALRNERLAERLAHLLVKLGTDVGEKGWLLRKVYVEERSYDELVDLVYPQLDKADRTALRGTLRKRVHDAKNRLRAWLGDELPVLRNEWSDANR
jgi:DNA-directed RNA polymerase specialized sigma24 family protein